LADRCRRCAQYRWRRAFPAIAVPPGTLRRGPGLGTAWFGIACKRGDAVGIEHAVVDADLIEVAAAQKVVAALHLVGRHHPPGEAELVQRGIVVTGGRRLRDFAAIDE